MPKSLFTHLGKRSTLVHTNHDNLLLEVSLLHAIDELVHLAVLWLSTCTREAVPRKLRRRCDKVGVILDGATVRM